MNAPTNSHATRAARIADAHATMWPPPASPAPDVVDDRPDWGTMNRELLAQKLASAYYSHDPAAPSDTRTQWLRVVDVAIAELQGTPDA